MRSDIATVIWKERKELGRQPGSRWRLGLALLVPILYFGIIGPWQTGAEWYSSLDSVLIAVVAPLLVVMLTVPDSFAGERERKTLATLLATRLDDRAILVGKVMFNVALGWGMALATLIVGMMAANVTNWSGTVRVIPAWLLATDVALSLGVAVLTAGLGVLLSMRSASVQQTQQVLAAALLLPLTVAGPLLLIIAGDEPGAMRRMFGNVDARSLAFWAVITVAGVGVFLLWLAVRRFTRHRLAER